MYIIGYNGEHRKMKRNDIENVIDSKHDAFEIVLSDTLFSFSRLMLLKNWIL